MVYIVRYSHANGAALFFAAVYYIWLEVIIRFL